jgi:hypothetical protein
MLFCEKAGIEDVPFFNEKGERRLQIHEENMRHHSHVIKDWAQSVISYGFAGIVRGTPIAIEEAPGSPLKLIAAGSMAQACYLAFELAPKSPLVQFTLKTVDGSSSEPLRFATTPSFIMIAARLGW